MVKIFILFYQRPLKLLLIMRHKKDSSTSLGMKRMKIKKKEKHYFIRKTTFICLGDIF